MTIVETERLVLRELEAARDAAFLLELLNTPKFIQYIGDRGVRNVDDAAAFIEHRYGASYREHGYGLYVVGLRDSPDLRVGLCGFVRRDTLPGPDIGFSFLPEFERKGYGFESAAAILRYGREVLDFKEVFAITTLDNDASGRLLEKLGFAFREVIDSDGEQLKLYHIDLAAAGG